MTRMNKSEAKQPSYVTPCRPVRGAVQRPQGEARSSSRAELEEGGGGGKPHNEVSAKVGEWRLKVEWPHRPKEFRPRDEENEAGPPRRPRRWTFALAAMSFIFGTLLAFAVAFELVPYIETTRVFGELWALKLGGGACVLGGTVLYLIRRLIHRKAIE
jgi:hypothetical protein